jgi:hypothetical protein
MELQKRLPPSRKWSFHQRLVHGAVVVFVVFLSHEHLLVRFGSLGREEVEVTIHGP